MIHLISRGGMGNQMFQYSLALRIRQITGDAEIAINGELHPFSADKRQQSLYHFQLKEGTRVCSCLNGYYWLARFVFSVVRVLGFKEVLNLFRRNRKSVSSSSQKLFSKGIYYVADPYMMPDIQKTDGNKHIYAYCQTLDVVKGMEEELKDVFTVKTPPSPENKAMLEEIQAQNAVCIHVRRGDYSQHPQYQICNEEYYANAVKHACQVLENPVFYLFSNNHDDIEWIKKNYYLGADIHYVDLNNSDYEELRLMTACRHFIISNSTYSWWAAILGKESEETKKVWAPSKWFKGSSDGMLCKDSWYLL